MFSVPSTVYHLASKLSTPILTVILVNGGWKSPRLSTLLVHPNGMAANTSGDNIGVTFGDRETRPQYANIAVSAAGGDSKAWGATIVCGASNMEDVLSEAVDVVQKGRSAVVELVIPDLDA